MAEREGLEPARGARRGKSPYVPLGHGRGNDVSPNPFQGSNLRLFRIFASQKWRRGRDWNPRGALVGENPPTYPLGTAGETMFPRTPSRVRILDCLGFLLRKNGGEGGIRTLERVLPLQRFSKPSP